MGARPSKTIFDTQHTGDFCVAYSVSNDFGKTWQSKKIIDKAGTLIIGNPTLTTDSLGNTFLALMRVDSSFFSSDIAVYKLNNTTNEFALTSIPVHSDNTLLD
ncbi:hypothetical protein A9P82_01865 [Arachidicoccus ginsenosidimutans]|nr:hypothetical protein A9P82_01865 [Arachidicoccus sp. BS20]